MAITNEIQQDIIALVVGMFNAAPGQAVLEDLANAKLSGSSDAQLANNLAATAEFRSIYPTILTNQQFAARLVDNLGSGLLAASDRQWAIDALTASLNGGATRGETALEAINALRAVQPSNTAFIKAKTAFDNKMEVASYFSIELNKNAASLAELQQIVANVNDTEASVVAAKAAADGSGQPEPGAIFLTVGNDIVTGTGSADLFIADVNQNALGQQVNTLGTGDRINGGAGIDTLEAQVTRGATFGDSNMAIAPRTTSVENVFLEAINADLPNQGGNIPVNAANTQVYVSAGNMTSLQQVWSSYSSADMIVQNLTTRTDAGALRNTSEVAIGMRYTAAADTNWQASDYHVYFADNNLISDVETTIIGSQANYWLLDQDSEQAGGAPLERIDRDGIRFTLDGVNHLIRPAGETLLAAGTHANYANIIRAELALLVAGGATQLAGIEVIVDPTNIRQTFNDAGDLVSIPAITLIDNNGGVFSNLGFTIPDEISGDFNVFGRTDTLPPVADTSAYVTSTIFLEKVGRGGDGGELVVGGMSKNSTNTWDGVQGVEQFNVNVVGGEDLPNSLAGLHSTNNQLQIVNITSVAGGNASLVIGNGDAYGLKDVQVLNAAAFNGDLSVSAQLTLESVAKYFDLNDVMGDAAMDNIFFDYSLTGGGDNTLVLDVSEEISAHDDFVLTVLTGTGNDTVTVSLESYSANSLDVNWYAQQKALANVSISTGAGDDVIWTPGSGDIIINAGSGNDTVYTDNTAFQVIANAPGGTPIIPNGTEVKAHWVTNAANTNIHDLLGVGTGTNAFLYGSTLTVTMSSATGVGAGAAGAVTNGYSVTVPVPTANGYVGNHTHINQAIKAAINSDPVLNKLLVAKDGPNFSLVIESLIDGEFQANDLAIGLTAPTLASINALAAGPLGTLQAAYAAFTNTPGNVTATAATIQGAIVTQVGNVTAAYQGVGGSSLATDGAAFVPAVAEVQSVNFANYTVTAAGAGDFTIDVDGAGVLPPVTVTLANNDSPADVATKTAAAINLAGYAGVTAAAVGAVVTVTHPAGTNVAPAILANGVVAPVFEPIAPVGEQQTVNFTNATGFTTGNFGVGGVIVNILAADTPTDIATKTAAAINAATTMSAPLGTVSATSLGAVVTVTFTPADGNVAAISVTPGSANIDATDAVVTDNVRPFSAGSAAPVVANVPVTEVTQGAPAIGNIADVGVQITGANSTELTDNTINLGEGQDVVVLSTSINANETLVWTGLNNGVNTIVNFSTTGDSADLLDFTAYLNNTLTNGVDIATSLQAGPGAVSASEVVVTSFQSLAAATGVTWANLTAASLATALNASANWTVATTAGMGATVAQKAVFMIANTTGAGVSVNDGEYKIFEVSMTNATSGSTGFTGVGLIGVADFGEVLTGISNANFVA